ncbi:hypothetical protein HZB88_00030 [archaeon]|nr:hypothetical protein [archaeon]
MATICEKEAETGGLQQKIEEDGALHIYVNGNNEFYEGLFLRNRKAQYITFFIEKLIETFSQAQNSDIPFLREGYELSEKLKTAPPKPIQRISKITKKPETFVLLLVYIGDYTQNEFKGIIAYFTEQFEKKPDHSLLDITSKYCV